MLKIRLTPSQKLRVLHIGNHLAVLAGLYLYSPWWILVSVLVWHFIGSLGISIGYHRLLSHRSFETTLFKKRLLSSIGCLATGGSPIAWVGAHRLHHKHVDTINEPHSWQNIGMARVYFHNWAHITIPRSVIKDIVQDPFQVFLHRYYFYILTSWVILLFLISPEVMIFTYCLPAVLAFHAFGMINLFGHLHGYQTFKTVGTATNSWVANLLTCGEGWHNNHHRFPSLYRIGLKSNECDFSAWILENFPLATNKDKLKHGLENIKSHIK
jgi:fatty-acid desaturase